MTPIYPTIKSYAEGPDTETLLKLSELIKEKVSNSVMLCCPESEEFLQQMILKMSC